jgi:hypothetical protein
MVLDPIRFKLNKVGPFILSKTLLALAQQAVVISSTRCLGLST